MKKNITYISIIFLLLLCESLAFIEEKQLFDAFWVNFFKILSAVLFVIWYYQEEKKQFNLIQKIFLISNLFAIIITPIYYFYTLKEGMDLIYCLNILVFLLWIYVFRLMGAKISYKLSDDFFKKLIPLFFVFPIVYYFLTLYPVLTTSFAILKLVFTLTISYACLLSTFLPINYEKKLWITLSLILFIYISLLYSNYLFIENKFWSYIFSRIILVISKCMMFYGMIDYNRKRNRDFNED